MKGSNYIIFVFWIIIWYMDEKMFSVGLNYFNWDLDSVFFF